MRQRKRIKLNIRCTDVGKRQRKQGPTKNTFDRREKRQCKQINQIYVAQTQKAPT